ncbi:hypothetical protein DMI65_05325 [Escherichia coli]|nr:hypothetical protein [Escherichia coli]
MRRCCHNRRSLKGGLRVTEQGEMIRFKYGLPEITVSSLSLYTGRFWKPTCCHRLSRKRAGVVLWMNCLLSLAMSTAATYVKTKILCLYFRSATPEQNWVNCRWVHVRRNVAQPAASSHCALFRGFSLDAKPPDAPPRLGAGTALQKWSKMANRASWKPCAAIGHSSRRVSACWRWSSPKQTCGWRNTMTNARSTKHCGR